MSLDVSPLCRKHRSLVEPEYHLPNAGRLASSEVQTYSQVKLLSQASGYSLFLIGSEVVLAFQKKSGQ